MKLSNEDLIALLKQIGGDDAVSLVEYIRGKENVSEFKIADKLKCTVNEVRSVLYKLNENNLVIFTRKKDKKKGWYIYFWTFVDAKADALALKNKKERMDTLKMQLNKEEGNLMFSCPRKCIRCNFENGMELQFKCPECESVLTQEDNTKRVGLLKKEFNELEQQVSALSVVEVAEEPEVKKKGKKVVKQVKKVGKIKAVKKPAKVEKKAVKNVEKKAKKVEKQVKKIEKPAKVEKKPGFVARLLKKRFMRR